MKGKYFCVDKNGMVLISKKELDEALNDAYNEGYQAGKNSYYYCGRYTYLNRDGITVNPYEFTCNSTATNPLNDLDRNKTTITC